MRYLRKKPTGNWLHKQVRISSCTKTYGNDGHVSMSSVLLMDTSLKYNQSYKSAESFLNKAVVQPLDKLENALKQILSFVSESKENAINLSKGQKDEESNISKTLNSILTKLESIEKRLSALENKPLNSEAVSVSLTNNVAKKADEFDLFGSDDEDNLAELQEKAKDKLKGKNKKVQKSALVLDVKPIDDTTDLVKLEEVVRSIEMDGLVWQGSQLVPLAFGIRVLRISCIIEDEKISTYDLEDKIAAFEELTQGMDIVAFNKSE